MTVATALAPVTTRSVPRPGYAAFESCFAPEPINVGRARHTSSVFLRLWEVAAPWLRTWCFVSPSWSLTV